jgi:hypothetical protein
LNDANKPSDDIIWEQDDDSFHNKHIYLYLKNTPRSESRGTEKDSLIISMQVLW